MLRALCLAVMLLGLAACGGSQHVSRPSGSDYAGPTCTDGPKSKYGNPGSYKVLGKWYTVKDSACGYAEKGIASWYGPNFHGKRTSSGETYDMHAMTAAHKTLPIPARVRVTNLDNGKSTVVRVNDRGPFHKGRVIDLSRAAAEQLGVIANGTARVEVEALGRPEQYSGSAERDYRNRLYVQVGSYGERGNAENMLARVREDGYDNADIQRVAVSGRALNRVRIGPLHTPAAARTVFEHLTELGYRAHKIITE